MAILDKTFLINGTWVRNSGAPPHRLLNLPEKVLQFGTGVLLRGLPDYFIDKANRQGVFNGRIVVVKSTDRGGIADFEHQDGLYTLHIKGIQEGKEIQESVVISSISRVLAAHQQWNDILEIGISPDLEIILSNTTEVGIKLDNGDDLNASPPVSFPAKLTAILYRRFLHFRGDENRGLVILPTELIADNGVKLRGLVMELAERHHLGNDFIRWLARANYFCNTLVDRIVPGKLPSAEQAKMDEELGYTDHLSIMAEPFCLWAIETSNSRVMEVLSFAKVDESVIIAPSIWKFKELKLRLLNGTHTFLCGLAVLAGFKTVKDAMLDPVFAAYVLLLQKEIVSAIIGEEINEAEAMEFSRKVVDRFNNPFLNHQWLSICSNYTAKMQMRNVPLLNAFFDKKQTVPQAMALGFAGYLVFMKEKKGEVMDEHASWFADLWLGHDPNDLVERVLKDEGLWLTDISAIPGFTEVVQRDVHLLMNQGNNRGVKGVMTGLIERMKLNEIR